MRLCGAVVRIVSDCQLPLELLLAKWDSRSIQLGVDGSCVRTLYVRLAGREREEPEECTIEKASHCWQAACAKNEPIHPHYARKDQCVRRERKERDTATVILQKQTLTVLDLPPDQNYDRSYNGSQKNKTSESG